MTIRSGSENHLHIDPDTCEICQAEKEVEDLLRQKPAQSIHPKLEALIDRLELDLSGYDSAIKSLKLKVLNDGEKISCDSCSSPGCCYQYVLVSVNEALIIARHIKLSGQDTPELRSRLLVSGTEMHKHTNVDWFKQVKPCVFLKDNRCQIYEKRPVACRALMALEDPAHCLPSYTGSVKYANGNPILEASVTQAIQLSELVGATDGRIHLLNLPRMVLRCLEALELEPDLAIQHIYSQDFADPEEFHRMIAGNT